ncbi:hypothetical protein AtNW77_Chr1g0020211 [Arabidopsis thaliana]
MYYIAIQLPIQPKMDKEIHQFGKGHVLHQMLRILELEVIQIMPKVMTNKKKPTLHIGV